jgi:hypothetical protein
MSSDSFIESLRPKWTQCLVDETEMWGVNAPCISGILRKRLSKAGEALKDAFYATQKEAPRAAANAVCVAAKEALIIAIALAASEVSLDSIQLVDAYSVEFVEAQAKLALL